MSKKFVVVIPNHNAHKVWADTYLDCLNACEGIHFEEEKFPNAKLNWKKISDTLNISKIRYIYKQLRQRSKGSTETNVFLFGPELCYLLLLPFIRIFLKRCRIWYMMHEPYVINQKDKRGYFLQWHNILMFRLSHWVILTSQNSLNLSYTYYGKSSKFVLIEFASIKTEQLQPRALQEFENRKEAVATHNIFTYYGSAIAVKRPDRLNLIYSIMSEISTNFRVIRAGNDIDVKVNYLSGIEVHNRYLNDYEILEFVFNSKVLVLPYDYVAQSGVVIEALGMGKVILVSDIPGFRQYEECSSIFYADFNSPQDLKEKLLQLVNLSAQEMAFYCKESVTFFNQHYSRKALIKRFNEIDSLCLN